MANNFKIQDGLDARGTVSGGGLTVTGEHDLRFDSNGSKITEQRPGQGYRYDAASTVAVTGTGSGLTLNVQFGVGETSYTTVLLNDVGTGYYIGDTVKIPGDQLGGTTPANDLIVEVTSMALAQPEPFGAGSINVVSGTPVGYEDGLHVRVNGLEWTFGNDGNLILNGGVKFGDGTVQTTAAGNEITNTNGYSTYSVSVATTGVVTMTTSRGGLEFGALPEPGGPTHFHIMRPSGENGSGGTDLYFGDDYNYVLQRPAQYGSNPAYGVEIGTNDNNGGDQHVWRFDTDGTLILPAGGDIKDSNGTSVLSGGGTTIPSYKGFRAHYGSMYDNNDDGNGPINKLVIYKDTVTPSSTISSDTDNDQFTVTGLTGSDIVAMLVVISDNITQTLVADLKTFVEAVIDNVILNNGEEGNFNNVDDMKIAFYNNFSSFNSIIPSVKTNFEFYNTNATYYNIIDWTQIINSGTGSGWNWYGIRYNTNTGQIEMGSGSTGGPGGFQVGDTLTILGTNLQDYQNNTLSSPANDIVITVDSVDGIGVPQSFTGVGTLPYTSPTWPTNNINDGGNDEYDTGNYINTDLANELSYNNGNAVYGNSNVGGGDYVVTYQSGIFGFFTRGASIDSIGTSGSSGFDGSGTSVTGGLYDNTPSTPAITWTSPNDNVWRIETYNGGYSGYYGGSDYDAKWFDAGNSPGGTNNFRGAIIEYHAFFQNCGTMIGTIHLTHDQTPQEATHTEHMNGNNDIPLMSLWSTNNERYQLYFKRTDGYGQNVMIQWTAKMFYGNESWC